MLFFSHFMLFFYHFMLFFYHFMLFFYRLMLFFYHFMLFFYRFVLFSIISCCFCAKNDVSASGGWRALPAEASRDQGRRGHEM